MGDFDLAELRRRVALHERSSDPWTDLKRVTDVASMADAAADEIDRLRAELVAAKERADVACDRLEAIRHECSELRRAVVAWEAITPGECFENEEEGDVFHAAHKVLAAVDGGAS